VTGKPVAGGCLCGAVRYESAALPIVTRTCWCRLCQYLGAGNGTVNCAFRTETFSITGQVKRFTSVADSGNVLHREFCPGCGTPMFSRAEIRPHLVFARAGTLDNPEIARPAATIWTSQAPTWACFDPGLPQVEGQPPPAA
jgi:hypothetical protein